MTGKRFDHLIKRFDQESKKFTRVISFSHCDSQQNLIYSFRIGRTTASNMSSTSSCLFKTTKRKCGVESNKQLFYGVMEHASCYWCNRW